jgi:hypothetical protein
VRIDKGAEYMSTVLEVAGGVRAERRRGGRETWKGHAGLMWMWKSGITAKSESESTVPEEFELKA